MHAQPDIASVAAAIGDPARATMLASLLGGKALPASDLAALAAVKAQTGSWHLQRLVEVGLLATEPQGRHRYYRLASPEVAAALEALQLVAPRAPVRSLRQSDSLARLRLARTCYDHLAGQLGVALAQRLMEDGVIEQSGRDFTVGAPGEERLQTFGIDVGALRRGRRKFAAVCLDWSERSPHVAGALGAALCARALDLGWVSPVAGDRAVRITEEGREGFARLGVALPVRT